MEYIPQTELFDIIMFPAIVLIMLAIVSIIVWLEYSERDFTVVNGRIKEVLRRSFRKGEV